jgi:hypothetical protein
LEKYQFKKQKKQEENLSQLGLTYQICNTDHEIGITSEKEIKINYEVQFATNLILKVEIEKKSIKKAIQPGLTY